MQTQNSSLDRIEEIERMRQGVEYSRSFQLRGFKVMLRPLTIGEHRQILAETAREVSVMPPEYQTEVTRETIYAGKILQVASSSGPDDKKFMLSEHIVNRMTVEEVNHLYSEWDAMCKRVSPRFNAMPAEEVAALVEEIKKNPSIAIEQSFLALVNACQLMAKALQTES